MRLSTQAVTYCRVPIRTRLPDGTSPDPTGDVVAFAFTDLEAVPDDSTSWTPGSWDSTAANSSVFTARCLIGTGVGGIVLTVADYHVWVRVSDDPEVPILDGGSLVMF